MLKEQATNARNEAMREGRYQHRRAASSMAAASCGSSRRATRRGHARQLLQPFRFLQRLICVTVRPPR